MDSNIIARKWIQGMTVKPDSLLGQAFTGEEGAHVFRITGETTGGAAVPITGTIAAKFLRSDNITVPLSGSISDGVAVVTLTDECYLVPGRFIFSIYVTQGDLRMCIYCGVGNVFRTDSGEYEGGQIITDITELINEIQEAVKSIPPDYSELTGEVADLKSAINSVVEETKSRNYYKGVYESGVSLNASGTTTANASRGIAWNLPVEGETTYYSHYALTQQLINFVRVNEYDSGGNVINSIVNANMFTTNANTVKIALCAPMDYFNDRYMLSTSATTGADTYQPYFDPYYGLKDTEEITESRTDIYGNSWEYFGDRMGNDEKSVEKLINPKFSKKWVIGDISSASSNYGQIVSSTKRSLSDVFSFENDISVSMDFTQYRAYLWTYDDANRTNPVGRGWITAERQIIGGTFFQLILGKLEGQETTIDSAYSDAFYSLTMKELTDTPELPKDYDFIVKGINHRGFSVNLPEESALAYKASARNGFKYVEVDVHFTSDNVPVCCHNEIVITDGTHVDPRRYTPTDAYPNTLNVESSTIANLDSYSWGYYIDPAYTSVKILRFADFLTICRNLGLHPYIEVKSSATYTDAQIATLVTMVKQHGLINNCTWISGDLTMLSKVLTSSPSARIGYVVGTPTQALIDNLRALETADNEIFMDCSNTGITAETAELCMSNNVPLEMWYAYSDEETEIINCNAYVTGITCNSKVAGKVLYDNTID